MIYTDGTHLITDGDVSELHDFAQKAEVATKAAIKLTVKGALPGLNEYVRAERGHKLQAARIKREAEALIMWAITEQLRGVAFERPVFMAYRWIEKNRRRDKDNIAFARKFIQDSLVAAGILQNDSWAQIEGFSDSFEVDRKNPRVEVEIWEVGR